ncbi:hypothetical protein K456DRAFT_1133326 [Colletotrichum gloeosporioides 23]|nr:hypothetical protein K456DRAFT_1133326 [Colletotrichum gloeosporioides 23]
MLAETRRCSCSARQGGRECWVSSISRHSCSVCCRRSPTESNSDRRGTHRDDVIDVCRRGRAMIFLLLISDAAGIPRVRRLQHTHGHRSSCCCRELIHLRFSEVGSVSLQSSDRISQATSKDWIRHPWIISRTKSLLPVSSPPTSAP